MADELEKQLKEAAGAHRPDRERMLARVERGMFEPEPAAPHRHQRSRGLGPWLRAVGATAVVAGVCAAGGYAVASAVQDDGPQQTVATSPTPEESTTTASPSPTASSSTRPSHHVVPPAKPPHSPKGTAHSSPPASPPVSALPSAPAGTLLADGSIDPESTAYWAQSNITFKNRTPLDALTVELRVALTDGVADTGNWRDLPVEDFTVSVQEEGHFLVYRWTLKAGRTVPAGQHVFAGQYNHAQGGRDAKDDTYTVQGTASGKRAEVQGDFA
ncbi:hypothetical protein [Streptomyces sp. NPDC050738]|uniref:hypothetical protein n=1 Tax=Streptomyces sp. NPDC050738 TaxID=3154744 RepID=UPI00343918CC